MPGVLGAGMQTIVHTPHGIQTMAPQTGQLTAISTPQATSTTVRPVTIAPPQSVNAQPKFQQTTVIKSSNNTEYNVPHPLRLGSEVSLVPQNPPSSHLGLNQQHLLTTATHQPQPSQQPVNQVRTFPRLYPGKRTFCKYFFPSSFVHKQPSPAKSDNCTPPTCRVCEIHFDFNFESK